MISKNFKSLLAFIITALIFSPLKGEDKIDIWKNKKNNDDQQKQTNPNQSEKKINLGNKKILDSSQSIKIENNLIKIQSDIIRYSHYTKLVYIIAVTKNFNITAIHSAVENNIYQMDVPKMV